MKTTFAGAALKAAPLPPRPRKPKRLNENGPRPGRDKRRVTVPFLVLVAVLAAASCERAPEGYREAQKNFDAFVGADCPSEGLVAIARTMGARSEDVRVVHYGPTGRQDHTNYFAALSREGDVLVGIYDEASTNVPEVQYENEFGRDDFAWAVKCLRNDPPFGDRKVRYGTALPVEMRRGMQDVTVKFVDGWLEPSQTWSAGAIKLNPAGTTLLREEHGLEFAVRSP